MGSKVLVWVKVVSRPWVSKVMVPVAIWNGVPAVPPFTFPPSVRAYQVQSPAAGSLRK